MKLNPSQIVSATDLADQLKQKTNEGSVDTEFLKAIDLCDLYMGEFLGIASDYDGIEDSRKLFQLRTDIIDLMVSIEDYLSPDLSE